MSSDGEISDFVSAEPVVPHFLILSYVPSVMWNRVPQAVDRGHHDVAAALLERGPDGALLLPTPRSYLPLSRASRIASKLAYSVLSPMPRTLATAFAKSRVRLDAPDGRSSAAASSFLTAETT
ncbi:hypothetical protein QFZ76_002471 [Streptomyces sp. V4I2]|nr:hypothetical protein [Streptomyces sp. V4I2]